MKRNACLVLILTIVITACTKESEYTELQSVTTPVFRLWAPVSYTPLAYAPDSSWLSTEIIYVPFEQSGNANKCGAIEFFQDGKLTLYDCGFCGTPPVTVFTQEQDWHKRNEEIVFRGVPDWLTGNYESRIVSATENQLRVIQERY